MPLYVWPVTAGEVDTELKLGADTSQDAQLSGFIAAATEIIENITGPITSTAYSEWHDGGQETILLRHYPIVSVESVAEYTPAVQAIAAEPTDATTTFTGYGYTIDTGTGLLTRTSGGLPYRFCGRVLVTYHAGQTDVPPSVRQAALELVRHLWETQRGSGPELPLPGDDGAEPGIDTAAPDFMVPLRVAELLAPYRKAPKVA